MSFLESAEEEDGRRNIFMTKNCPERTAQEVRIHGGSAEGLLHYKADMLTMENL